VAARTTAPIDELLAERIARLIALHPTFGYRRLWALLRFGDKVRVNRKAVYRVLRLKRWFVHQRSVTPTATGPGPNQPRAAQQPALGDGPDSRLLRLRWLGPSHRGYRLS
jgi:hypothetical protein